ncbi:restless-like transposase [Ilyonectria robusta]
MLVELIVSSNQSFSFAENPILREIFDYLNLSVSIQCANLSARAVRYKIIQEYNRHKQKVVEVLRNSSGALYILFNGWTSRNKLALYGVGCFFRDEKNRLYKIIIGVPEAYRHFGLTIGGEVLDVLYTFGVSLEKIGYFTLHNAENNNTAIEVIGAELGFDSRLRRGRYIGHIINLSAKALLFGKNAGVFEQQLSGAEALSDTEYAQWRKKEPVSKLYNIVVDVHISYQLIYLFKEVQRKNSRLPNSIPAYAAAIVGDEYQAWQTDRDASDGNIHDPIGYWITKQSRYPWLSRMALGFLTIQPMSAECERLSSAAGKMVSGLRTDLDAEIIAICQVLRSWYRAGLIKDLDLLLKSHLESNLDAGCGTLSDDELALAELKWLLEGEDSASEVDDSSQQQQAEELVSASESEAE